MTIVVVVVVGIGRDKVLLLFEVLWWCIGGLNIALVVVVLWCKRSRW